MKYISSKEARQNFSETVRTAFFEPVTVQKHGMDVAVLLSPREYKRLTETYKRLVERNQGNINDNASNDDSGSSNPPAAAA